MGEIIMNEREWAERALRSHSLGNDPVVTLGRLARYYHTLGFDRVAIERALRDFMLRCDSYIDVDMWMDIISSRAKNAGKYKLIEIDYIPITENEIETIKTAENHQLQQLLFTLVCLAKYTNFINPRNKNWVNNPYSEIFGMANVVVARKAQPLFINDLYRAGLIRLSHIIDNININIPFVDNDGPVVLKIADFRNLGYQYLKHIGEPCVECFECGIVVKRKSPRQKYCPHCAKLLEEDIS